MTLVQCVRGNASDEGCLERKTGNLVSDQGLRRAVCRQVEKRALVLSPSPLATPAQAERPPQTTGPGQNIRYQQEVFLVGEMDNGFRCEVGRQPGIVIQH